MVRPDSYLLRAADASKLGYGVYLYASFKAREKRDDYVDFLCRMVPDFHGIGRPVRHVMGHKGEHHWVAAFWHWDVSHLIFKFKGCCS